MTVSKAKANPPRHEFTQVISIVSHQLKTPLAVIKGYLEVLVSNKLGTLNKKQKEYLDDVLQNTHRMLSLINDLLNVSRIEEGMMEFRPAPCSLKKIVQETIDELSVITSARNCVVFFNVEGEVPLLNIDFLKIKQVVSNIISNAVVYNDKKGIVKVWLKADNKKVLFCCQDNGFGIDKWDKYKIFKKFFRGEKAVVHITEGSGLGLFISKAIIEGSGGEVWFKSKSGAGSTFCFSLPIKNKK